MFSRGGWNTVEKTELSSGTVVTINGFGSEHLILSAYNASALTRADEAKLISRIQTICVEYCTWYNEGSFIKMDPTEITVDFSNVNFSNYPFNNADGVNFLEPLKGKCTVYLIKDKDTNNDHEQLLSIETLINGKTREAVGEDYMRNLLKTSDSYYIIKKVYQRLQDFHSSKPPLGSEFFKDVNSYLLAFTNHNSNTEKEQVSHQLSVYEAISSKMVNLFGWNKETFETLKKKIFDSNESLNSSSTSLAVLFGFCVRFLRTNVSQTGLAKENYQKVLLECFSFSTRQMREGVFYAFLWNLQKNKDVLDKFLENAKSRRYSIAVLLSGIYKDSWNENARKALHFFCQKDAYTQGMNQRLVIEMLMRLVAEKDIMLEKKQQLLENGCQCLNLDNHHYETWGLILTLLACEIPEEINKYLEEVKDNQKLFDLQEFYWNIFKQIFKLEDNDRVKYNEHFKPIQNPNHHLLLRFYQSSIEDESGEEGQSHAIFSSFIKAFLEKGEKGYREFRYTENNNTHLKDVFNREGGLFLKEQWMNCHYEAPIALSERKCRVYITDDIWDELTWGIGLHCLDPLDTGSGKHKALILDGRNQLVLLRDEKNQVLGGAVLHLLLLGEGKEQTPALVLANIYLGSGLKNDNEKEIAQVALDKIVTEKANDMKIPFLALKFPGNEYGGRGKIPLENSPILVVKKGIFDDLTGVDYEMLAGIVLEDASQGSVRPCEKREDYTAILRYLKIYSPPTLEMSDSTFGLNWLFKEPDAAASSSIVQTLDPKVENTFYSVQ